MIIQNPKASKLEDFNYKEHYENTVFFRVVIVKLDCSFGGMFRSNECFFFFFRYILDKMGLIGFVKLRKIKFCDTSKLNHFMFRFYLHFLIRNICINRSP